MECKTGVAPPQRAFLTQLQEQDCSHGARGEEQVATTLMIVHSSHFCLIHLAFSTVNTLRFLRRGLKNLILGKTGCRL